MMKPPLRSQLLIGWIHLCLLLLTFPLFLPLIQSASSPSTLSTPSALSSPSAIPAPQYFDLRMSALSSSHHPSLYPPLSSSSSLSSPTLSSSSSFMSIPPTPSLSSISSMRKRWSPLRVVGRGKDKKRSISFNEQAMHQYPANEDDEGRVAKELEKDDESDYNQVLEGRRISQSDDARAGSFGQVATHPNSQGLVGGNFFPDEKSRDEEEGDEREKDGINEGEEDSRVGRNNRNVVMKKRHSHSGSQSSSSYAGLLSPGFQRKGFLFPSSSFLPSFGVLSSRQSFPSLSRIISGEEQFLPRSSYKQHEEKQREGEKLIKSGGRKRALSFFAHWRPVDQVEEQQPFMSKGSIFPSIATSQETSFIPPITSRGSTIQSRKPALLRWG